MRQKLARTINDLKGKKLHVLHDQGERNGEAVNFLHRVNTNHEAPSFERCELITSWCKNF